VSEAAPPPGFTAAEPHDAFEAHVGPLFERAGPDGERIAAFRVHARHLRPDGAVHEGMMMTFADSCMRGTAWRAAGGRPCVTLSMQTSFPGDAREGALVECRTYVERGTRAIIFVSATLMADGMALMTATSLWKVLGEK
jgi:acyl-coenzyme A thioesterase PaaI-like protein